MCYSAQVWQAYQEYVRQFGAILNIRDFAALYGARENGAKIKTTKAMDDAFLRAGGISPELGAIAESIRAWNAQQATELEQLLFQQRTRLVAAQRRLATRSTKKALADERIAGNKIAWAKAKLADLRRTAGEERDARIFPGVYAPVMVMEGGRRVIKPMRYQCRPAGKPANIDAKFPGTYNARRDNLEGFWGGLFGYTHGVMVTNAFYENVSRHRAQGRELAPGEEEESVVLEFRPEPRQNMLVACLVSHWKGPGEDLWSFAAITDEPPAEVAAAGHDRCIVPIKAEHLDAWLNPHPKQRADLYRILDDRERPYYEHRMAA